MVYFGENSDCIMCECEVCKREIYAARNSVAEEDAYSYHLENPLKCSCGNIDEYINKSKKSCYHIRQELSALSNLLHQHNDITSRISSINSEITKRFNPPTFLQSLLRDLMFAGKIFFYMLGALIGIQIFMFIITLILFISGLVLDSPGLISAGNELFYNLNIFKGMGGAVLSGFGMPAEFTPLEELGERVSEELILDYIPYALVGALSVVFYIFLAILAARVAVNLYKLVFFASKVMNQRIRVNQRRESYERELNELKHELSGLEMHIDDAGILGPDYKNIRAADSILKYFENNRVDTMREAVNLYHEEDFRNKQLEYSKALFAEAKQTRRYTKAMYMITSDSNIKVEVRDEPEPPARPSSQPIPQQSPVSSSVSKKKEPGLLKSVIAGRIKLPERGNKNTAGNTARLNAADNAGENSSSDALRTEAEPKGPDNTGEPRQNKSSKSKSGKTETFSSIFESDDSEKTAKETAQE